jgi:hypothetical protein
MKLPNWLTAKRVGKKNYIASLVMVTIAFVFLGLWLWSDFSLATLWTNHLWKPQMTLELWNAVTWIALQGGIALVTAIAVTPLVILAFIFYMWGLSDRIRKLESLVNDLQLKDKQEKPE